MDRSVSLQSLTRRRLLATSAALGAAGLAGCTGDDAEGSEPISLDDEQSCDNCGMIVEAHPGPAGQAFYDDPDVPADHEGPAWFCSSLCTYTYTFDREEDGTEPSVVYLTDYSTVDYEFSTEDGTRFLSKHVESDAFADATTLSLVAGPDVQGAMGPAIVPFSDREDAEAFAEEYGGDRLSHGDVTRDLVSALMR